jgi:hypothetical protein
VRGTVALAVLMMLVGAVLLVLPLLAGAPLPHPDEFNATFWPLLVALGDPAPEVFYYPYFHTYVLALLHILHGVVGAPAAVSLHAWLGIRYFWEPDSALQLARWVNVLCGCLTMGLVTGLARRLYVPMAMWYVAAVWAAVRLATTSGPRAYLWAACSSDWLRRRSTTALWRQPRFWLPMYSPAGRFGTAACGWAPPPRSRHFSPGRPISF